jgi:pimeloyl-ACP methyl ester carboxylesterase
VIRTWDTNLEIRMTPFKGANVEILPATSLVFTLLLAVNASTSAQSNATNPSRGPKTVDKTTRGNPPKPAACRDTTPHTRTFVTVDKGVQLEVLDWGGKDKPATMVLLTGLGDNAHVYDQFAFQFTDYFHVVGITRRGFLPSSPSEEGYDVETRAHDDIEVIKALGIHKAVFVGHSIAGSELTRIAITHRDYVDKLVYLDALDLSERFQLPDVPPLPYVLKVDDRSLEIFRAAQARLENTLRPVQAICIGLQFDPKGAITDTTTPDWVSNKILAGVKAPANPPTDWARVEAPRLGIFDLPSVGAKLPFYWYLSLKDQQIFNNNWPGLVRWFADTIDKFAHPQAGTPNPVVYTLPDAPHYFYTSDQAFVVRVMREFLLGKVDASSSPGNGNGSIPMSSRRQTP